MTQEVTNIDERGMFKGNDEQLCNCIEALIELNDNRATTPHVPAMAVSLLLAASARLTAAHTEAAELKARVEALEEALRLYGDRIGMANAPAHLQQEIDQALGGVS